MQIFFLTLYLFISQSSAFAFVVENTSDGLGLETLMSGIGQARLGSTGALGSNPALLAWLPKQHVFMSTNQVNFYKIKAKDGEKLDISPEVIPRFAASSEGFDQWGHSYGLILNKLKIGLNQGTQGQRTSGTQETQTLLLSYGLGHKIAKDTAWGISFYAGRIYQKGDFSALGESDGYEFAFTVRDTKTFWIQGFSLGVASKFDSWSFGLSSKFNTATFWTTGSQEQSGYSEASGTNSSEVEHKVPHIKVVSNFRAGIQKELEKMRLFFDISWLPSYSNRDIDDYTKSQLSLGLGLEGDITEPYQWYTGFMHIPGNSAEQEGGSISLGLSKKNKHSMNYAGLSWARAYRIAESEIVQINFGTNFDH